MDDAQSAVLQDFMSITGVDDAAAATVVLEATAWVLEDAVNLQLATGGDLGGGSTGATGATAAGAPLAAPLDEEEVRAPLPVVRDRLYGDFGGPQGAMPRVTRWACIRKCALCRQPRQITHMQTAAQLRQARAMSP